MYGKASPLVPPFDVEKRPFYATEGITYLDSATFGFI